MLDLSWLPQPVADALKKIFKKLKTKFEIGLVPISLAALTILTGLVGWAWKSFDWTFHSVVLIAMRALANFNPSVKNLDEGNYLTDAAALFGLLTLYSSALIVAAAVLRESRRKLTARLFARDHVVIVGNTSLARRAVDLWRPRERHLLQIIPPDLDRPTWKSKSVRHDLDDTLVNAFSLQRARQVLIDLDENGATLALAYGLLAKMATDAPHRQGRDSDGDWIVVGRDLEMTDHFITKVQELRSGPPGSKELPSVHFLDPERLAARDVVSSRPLFLEAERRGRHRIHVLIVGGTSLAWHLIELTYLSALTDGLDTPMVTVLTPAADIQRRRFFSGRAALADAVDIAFLDAGALDDFQSGETTDGKRLQQREQAAPVTSILSILENFDENIRTAIRIDAIRSKTDCFDAAVLIRNENEDGKDLMSPTSQADQIFGDFSTFSLADSFLETELCDPAARDVLPRALHERYAKTAGASPIVAWGELSESLRRANRNAAIHWRAKLHTLGFDVGSVPADKLPRLTAHDARELLDDKARTTPEQADTPLDRAARCEHRRWTIERLLDGWTVGEVRDEIRKTHPLLVPWEELVTRFPQQVVKNREQVVALILCLQAAGDPDIVVQKRKAS